MKIIEYVPNFLQEVREFKILSNIEDEELEKLKLQIDNILKEVIVNTSEDYGLKRYEKIYNITYNTFYVKEVRGDSLSMNEYEVKMKIEKVYIATNESYSYQIEFYSILLCLSSLWKKFPSRIFSQISCSFHQQIFI